MENYRELVENMELASDSVHIDDPDEITCMSDHKGLDME